MDDWMTILVQVGQFSALTIVLWVVVMLFISFLDRHPRDPQPPEDQEN